MRILGISAFYHDSAAAMVTDGRIVAAAQEERFTRKRHDSGFPKNAMGYCLAEERCALEDIDLVAFYDKPFLKFERLLETYLSFAPRGFRSFRMAMPLWMREKLFQKTLLRKELHGFPEDRILFAEHHLSHAASAFYPSPFEEAAVLTLDGVGEWATTSFAVGRGSHLEIRKEIHFPHSLGLLYSAFTYYTGFRVNSGEYKVMGLAPYGRPRYAQAILENLIDVKPDGSFRLDLKYFDYCTGLAMTSSAFDALFGGPPRDPEEALTQRHMDLAASIQAVVEHVMLRLTDAIAADTGMTRLCLAGGVALNCVANAAVQRRGRFSDLWIQPAAGDAGGAAGAGLAAYHLFRHQPRAPTPHDAMQGAYLGPGFDQTEIEQALREHGADFAVMDERALLDEAVRTLCDGKALGWFQGRMEFGPRALGNRSILADARSPVMQKVLNLKVKKRESFRPFAPSVLREEAADWFVLDVDSPYMLLTAEVLEGRRIIPAVTHVDYSARVQTVHRETNPLYHALLSRFFEVTGCPVLVNTSFNVRGEPIVCTPSDAFRCFMGTDIDALAIGNCFLRKERQNPALARQVHAFALD